MFTKTIATIAFVALALICAVLLFEVYHHNESERDNRENHQQMVERAAKLYVQAQTQNRVTMAAENVITASVLLQEIDRHYRGLSRAEKILGLNSGELVTLSTKVKESNLHYRSAMTDAERIVWPAPVNEFEELAGLTGEGLDPEEIEKQQRAIRRKSKRRKKRTRVVESEVDENLFD